AGLSQAEAGARVGMTSQGWGLYEAGKRPGLFRPDVQRRLTGPLGASPEALELKLGPPPAAAAPAASGLEERGRGFSAPPAATRRLQLSNDDLAPWAASGMVLEYDPDRWPRRGQGCVIEMVYGGVMGRMYEAADAGALVVRGVDGVEERIDRAATRRVSAVIARLDV